MHSPRPFRWERAGARALLSHRPIYKTKIENLIHRCLFSGVAETFLSELDGAFHPRFVTGAVDRQPVQIQLHHLVAERGVGNFEIVDDDFARFGAVLPREMYAAHASF